MADTTESQLVKLGRYELVTRLAVGGMAELFLARERGLAGLERMVVIKKILPHLASQNSFVDMFLREARIAARLAHPNVIQIFELNEEDGAYYIAMEYIHGSTVRELQILADEHGARFPVEVSLSVFEQAARGLHAAHDLTDLDGKPLGLVHRDVSPHNLMVTTEGNVKLLDFGVAKATEGIESTYSGNLKGKFAYMSPEQCMRSRLDRRSDIFALGIVLWELLVGQRLFKRKNELEMMQAIINGDVPRPSALGRSLPLELEDAVMKALSIDRDRRFETVDAFRQEVYTIAKAEGLELGTDRIAAFVKRIAGEQLDQRHRTLQNALERSLTARESAGLLHRTGSQTMEEAEADTRVDKSLLDAIRDGTVDREALERKGLLDPGSDSVGSGSIPSISQSHRPESSPEADPDFDPAGMSAETVISTPSEASVDESAATTELSLMERDEQGRQTDDDSHSVSMTASTAPPVEPSKRRTPLWVAGLGVALIAGIIAIAVASLTTPGAQKEQPDDTVLLGKPLKLGWAPTVEAEQLKREVRPLHDYLETQIGRPMPVVVPGSYDELSEMLLDGEIDFAVLPPFLYVKTHASNPRVEPLVFKAFDGAIKSDGLLLVRMDSDVSDLSELEGKTFCFTNPDSTTGHFLPRAFLRKSGFDPGEFVGKIHWSGEHMQVMRDLLDGKCEAAATYSGALIAGYEVGISTGKIRTLAITGNIPQDVIAAGPHVSKQEREKLRQALAEFKPSDVGTEKSLGETQRIGSFQPATDKAYKSLRDAIDTDRDARDGTPANDAGE